MPLDDAHGHVVVDTRGTFCPIPIIRTAEAVRNLHPGGVVEVISDDPAIEYDMPAWCKSTGNAIQSYIRKGSDFHYVVVKK